MGSLSLSTRLFLSCFLVSAMLFCGIFFYLKGYNGRVEDARATAAFERAISHYSDFRREHWHFLKQAANLVSTDSALRKTLTSGDQHAVAQALESQKDRLQADLAFVLDASGKALKLSQKSAIGAQDELTEGMRPFFAKGAAWNQDVALLKLGSSLYQVALAPLNSTTFSGWIGLGHQLSGPQMDRLSGTTGLHHVLLRTKPSMEVDSGAFSVSPADLGLLESVPPNTVLRTALSTGHYLVKAPSSTQGDGWRLLLLFPLADFETASRELLEAFLVAGLALLLLTTIFSQLLAQEISRPLTNLRDKVRMIASKIGLDPPEDKGDEIKGIAKSYIDLTEQLQQELDHRKLALDELEAYKGELLKVNGWLRSRLFQVRVMLSLWNQQENAQDVKQFLSSFLETLLPGLPFDYGCVIIRPLAEMESEVVFAKVDRSQPGEPAEKTLLDEEDIRKDRTHWTSIIDPRVKDYLLRESQSCMASSKVIVGSLTASISQNGPDCPVYVLSVRLKRGDEPLGSLHFLTEKASPALGELFFEFLLNLSNQVAAQLQIHALSYATRVDPLTRLYNKGYLHDRLREEAMRASRSHSPFSLLLLDIDHFKKVNHIYGQQAGDEVLRGLATLLKRTCRGSDAVCRYSATEIAIILADTPLSGAKIFAENVRKSVETEIFPVPGATLKITVSMGLAESPLHGKGGDELLEKCSEGLREAKRRGRNQWMVHEEDKAA